MVPPRSSFLLHPVPQLIFLFFVMSPGLRTAKLIPCRCLQPAFEPSVSMCRRANLFYAATRMQRRSACAFPSIASGSFAWGRKESSNDPSRSLGEGTGELKIVTDIPRSIASWGRAEYPIDFEVVLPAGIPLQVRDTSGSIRISPLNAPVEVHDGSGTLMISDVHGVVTVVKDSGDIQVEPVSDVTR